MKHCLLAATATLSMLALTGCGTTDSPAVSGPASSAPFEIAGSWLYLGPSDGPHTLTITDQSMAYADVDGKWASSWSVKATDNDLHHFQVAFVSGSGSYLPVGQAMSGSYALSGPLLTLQLANGASYPALQSPGTCTDASATGTPVPDCSLYIKQ